MHAHRDRIKPTYLFPVAIVKGKSGKEIKGETRCLPLQKEPVYPGIETKIQGAPYKPVCIYGVSKLGTERKIPEGLKKGSLTIPLNRPCTVSPSHPRSSELPVGIVGVREKGNRI
jgi:hypothetical protein